MLQFSSLMKNASFGGWRSLVWSWLAGRAALAGYCDIVMVRVFFVGISGGSLRLKFGILTSKISGLDSSGCCFLLFWGCCFF